MRIYEHYVLKRKEKAIAVWHCYKPCMTSPNSDSITSGYFFMSAHHKYLRCSSQCRFPYTSSWRIQSWRLTILTQGDHDAPNLLDTPTPSDQAALPIEPLSILYVRTYVRTNGPLKGVRACTLQNIALFFVARIYPHLGRFWITFRVANSKIWEFFRVKFALFFQNM